jgi:hypothetical protein
MTENIRPGATPNAFDRKAAGTANPQWLQGQGRAVPALEQQHADRSLTVGTCRDQQL